MPTTGLADGVYTLEVSLLTPGGDPLPGQAAATIFSVGQAIPFSVTASPSIVPPGSSTVTTTITFANQNANPIAPTNQASRGTARESSTWDRIPARTGFLASGPRSSWAATRRSFAAGGVS